MRRWQRSFVMLWLVELSTEELRALKSSADQDYFACC